MKAFDVGFITVAGYVGYYWGATYDLGYSYSLYKDYFTING